MHELIATYLLQPLRGSGYQFYSGIASSINEWMSSLVVLGIAMGTWWHHNNCIEHRCLRKGHKDPEHGHPVCARHQDRLSAKR